MGKISLYDYEVLCNEVFYRGYHIFKWIELHPDMSDLDKQAIKATIMDALVTRGCINPTRQSLNFEDSCIEDNLEHYVYEKNPNVCGIPLWMKDEFRKKILVASGGAPVSIWLSFPSPVAHCIVQHNYSVSSFFDEAKLYYDVKYVSPTRGIMTENPRPFVEVNIWGEDYLVDVLTKRIFKSSFFKENYKPVFGRIVKPTEVDGEEFELLQFMLMPKTEDDFSCVLMTLSLSFANVKGRDEHAEFFYELEKSKEFFPNAWAEAEVIRTQFGFK